MFDKLVAVMLDEARVVKQKDLVKFFGIHTNTLTNWKNKVYTEGPGAGARIRIDK